MCRRPSVSHALLHSAHACVPSVTMRPMVDPVVTADGHTYERVAIEQWLQMHDMSPMTGEPLPSIQVAQPRRMLPSISAARRSRGASRVRTARRVGRDCGAATSVLVCGCLLLSKKPAEFTPGQIHTAVASRKSLPRSHALAGIPNPTDSATVRRSHVASGSAWPSR